MKITFIYLVGSALESCTYENVLKFKLKKDSILKFWYKSNGKTKVVEEDLMNVKSFTVKGW